MVYIKLGAALLHSLKPLVPADKLVHCEKDYYVAYPDFSTAFLRQNKSRRSTTCKFTRKSGDTTS
jgi:hypothetical protein